MMIAPGQEEQKPSMNNIEVPQIKMIGIPHTWLYLNIAFIIFILLLVGVGIGFYYVKVQQMAQTVDQLQQQTFKIQQSNGFDETSLSELQKTVSDQGFQLQQQHQALERLALFNAQRQTEVFLQVASVNQKIDAMPLLGSQFTKEKTSATSVSGATNTWSERWRKTLNQLKQLIVIRKTPDPLLPLIAQENGDYIYQYIHLQLGQAQWAVLRNNNDVYQACLAEARVWVSRYFVAHSQKTKMVLDEIETLQKINVSFSAIADGEAS